MPILHIGHISAIAITRGRPLLTRNPRDFDGLPGRRHELRQRGAVTGATGTIASLRRRNQGVNGAL